MATINYTSEANLEGGYVKVEWSGIGPGDDAQPFECSGLLLGSIHYWGDFGDPRGTVRICGSNELTPTNFGEFAYSEHPRLQLPIETAQTGSGQYFMGAVRPLVDANVVSVGVAILFVKKDD